MSALPGYLGALARAGDWSLPADDATDDATEAARPRPRGRFEPDGIDGDCEWGEVAEGREREVAAPPSAAVDAPARPVPPAPPPTADFALGPATADAPGADLPEPVEAATLEPGAIEPPAAGPGVETVRVEPAAALEPRTVDAPPHAEVVADLGDPVEARPGPDTAPVATATAAIEPPDRSADPDPHPVPAAPEVVTERVVHEARPAPAAPLVPVGEDGPEPADDRVADDGPTIVVEIGRIEVRLAADPAPAPRPAVRPAAPGPSLADYLQQRDPAGVRPA